MAFGWAAMGAAHATNERNSMKKRSLLKALFAAAFVCASAVLAEEAAPIKGNPDSKIYHKSTCKHYAAKGCTVEFKSEQAAVEAGYKPCKLCAAPKSEKKTEKKTETETTTEAESTATE